MSVCMSAIVTIYIHLLDNYLNIYYLYLRALLLMDVILFYVVLSKYSFYILSFFSMLNLPAGETNRKQEGKFIIGVDIKGLRISTHSHSAPPTETQCLQAALVYSQCVCADDMRNGRLGEVVRESRRRREGKKWRKLLGI